MNQIENEKIKKYQLEKIKHKIIELENDCKIAWKMDDLKRLDQLNNQIKVLSEKIKSKTNFKESLLLFLMG
jgi:regulator of sirC expression with transglutaminase-like and TPR domain